MVCSAQQLPRTTAEIIADVDAFVPASGEWLQLDALLQELWSDGSPSDAIVPLLKVFERFPLEDGNGVFWSIIHGLEHLDRYENSLLNSFRRQPSSCGLTMVSRLINGGTNVINGTSLIELLETVSSDDSVPPALRDEAIGYVQYQREKPAGG